MSQLLSKVTVTPCRYYIKMFNVSASYATHQCFQCAEFLGQPVADGRVAGRCIDLRSCFTFQRPRHTLSSFSFIFSAAKRCVISHGSCHNVVTMAGMCSAFSDKIIAEHWRRKHGEATWARRGWNAPPKGKYFRQSCKIRSFC